MALNQQELGNWFTLQKGEKFEHKKRTTIPATSPLTSKSFALTAIMVATSGFTELGTTCQTLSMPSTWLEDNSSEGDATVIIWIWLLVTGAAKRLCRVGVPEAEKQNVITKYIVIMIKIMNNYFHNPNKQTMLFQGNQIKAIIFPIQNNSLEIKDTIINWSELFSHVKSVSLFGHTWHIA